MTRKILIVDDDKKLVELLKLYLERDGYRIDAAYDGAEALERSRRGRPSLVVLDLMLPVIDGLDVCRILRAESDVPIIMLTARSTEEDMLHGLDLGADDYVTKPFSPRQLVARVRAVLRRVKSDGEGPSEIGVGDLLVDLKGREARIAGTPARLTPSEFRLLATLAEEPGRAFSRLELMEKVFGYDYEGLERTLDVHIMNLRKKIEPDPARPIYVLTVYGHGYKLGVTSDE
jgi:DNA-binding response OmpR family regulator